MNHYAKDPSRQRLVRRASVAVAAIAGCAALAAAVASATIPDSGGAYSACVLKDVGTIRIIDPSLPPENLMSHCVSLEEQIGWRREGQTGPPGPKGETGGAGPAGTQGPNGDPGERGQKGAVGPVGAKGPTGDQGPIGDAGAEGDEGSGDFSGDYVSPNGLYKLSVTNAGIELSGPLGRTKLEFGGLDVTSFGPLTVTGGVIRLNDCRGLVALVGGQVLAGVTADPVGNPIFTGFGTILGPGAPTVCAG